MPTEPVAPAIEARGVRRVYNVKPTPVVALDGVDLDVAPGEFFGLLGPNGAGKTTLIKILTTLLLPSAGTARIFGFDVSRDERKIRRIMNMVAGGEQSGYGILTVREQLWMFSQFYGLTHQEVALRRAVLGLPKRKGRHPVLSEAQEIELWHRWQPELQRRQQPLDDTHGLLLMTLDVAQAMALPLSVVWATVQQWIEQGLVSG